LGYGFHVGNSSQKPGLNPLLPLAAETPPPKMKELRSLLRNRPMKNAQGAPEPIRDIARGSPEHTDDGADKRRNFGGRLASLEEHLKMYANVIVG
jgi:hypothetical protein